MPYKQHLDYFGGPEPYANAILQKEASGGPISDPAAAAAFRNAYPDLFQNTAQNIAGRQAYNVGVPASNIDPNYTQSVATGTPYAAIPAGGVPQGTASALPAGYAPRPYVAPQQSTPSFQDILAQLRGIAQPGLEARKGVVKQEAQTQMEEGYKNILDQLARQGILKSGQSFTRNEELLGRVNRDLAARLALLEGQTEEQVMQQALARMSDLEQRGISAEQEAYNRWFQGEQTGMGLEQQAYERQRYTEEVLREQQAAKKKEDIEEDERKWKRAEYLIKESPVVTNEVSLITGLPVGTPTRWATEIIQKHLNELEIQSKQADADLKLAKEDNAAALVLKQYMSPLDRLKLELATNPELAANLTPEQLKVLGAYVEPEKEEDPLNTIKTNIGLKIATGGIESLTDNEKALAPSLGFKLPTGEEPKISPTATNIALSEFTTLTQKEQKTLLTDPERLGELADNGVDVTRLWEAYQEKMQR